MNVIHMHDSLMIKADAKVGGANQKHMCAGHTVMFEKSLPDFWGDGKHALQVALLGHPASCWVMPEHIVGWGEDGLGFPYDWPTPTPKVTDQERLEYPCPTCKRPNDYRLNTQGNKVWLHWLHVNCWACGHKLDHVNCPECGYRLPG